MPELPEVETIRLGLEPVLQDQVLQNVICHRSGLRYPFDADFRTRLSGARIHSITRRSKYILCHLKKNTDAFVLMIHLGMTGRFSCFRASDEIPECQKHDHVQFILENGSDIRYNDARRFGFMKLIAQDDLEADTHLKKLGWEPLGNHFNATDLWLLLLASRRSLKHLLMDQSIIAGLGNIYVCEALFKAGIHPEKMGKQISELEVTRLVQEIREILRDALSAGGSSLKDYQQVNGQSGYFQMNFHVYGRQGEACRKTGCSGKIMRIRQQGRSTFFCPSCQKLDSAE